MAEKYNPKDIEKKWQDQWQVDKTYSVSNDASLEKMYILDMFPYPSGEGLHVGHPRGYIATDIYSRFKRMHGYSVLHPMGWDAFGLPAENYAIKNKVHPRVAVEQNVARFKEQLSIIGPDYDWSHEINTTDPEFYKWTQWMFLKMYEKGLAYESFEPINWCPECQTGLANEDLEADGTCERCGNIVEKKPMRQWVLKITDYADRLLEDLNTLSKWPEGVKEAQRNWIGKSEGSEISFRIMCHFELDSKSHYKTSKQVQSDKEVKVFTTRADTLFGATYIVLAPEHELVKELSIKNREEVDAYVKKVAEKSEMERTAEGKEKTGVKLEGITVVNPANNEELPVYVADYVLAHYGTGAVMAVPAHDQRDFEFAKKFDLPIKKVVYQLGTVEDSVRSMKEAFTELGIISNSTEIFEGLTSQEAKQKITEFVNGEMKSTYRLKDWVFSRQRYWGEPIPMIHCVKCGTVPVPYDQLPVVLPEVESYEPTGTGESPLADIASWVNVDCPVCNGKAKRETNTMPQWAGSSWYYLRYVDPKNLNAAIDSEKEKHWLPVDVYVGGDHATRHLIYARFWHKFLLDIDVVSTLEPFPRLEFLGFILAEDGRKMSKRWGNIINPDEMVDRFGADAFRLYEMFIGPFENTVPWSTDGLVGTRRFVEKVWRQQFKLQDVNNEALTSSLQKTINKVTGDIENFKFNTAVSQLMIVVNEIDKADTLGKEQFAILLKLLAPFMPHASEELWQQVLGNKKSVHLSDWPIYDETKIIIETVKVVVQINGKVRATLVVSPNITEEEIVTLAREHEKIKTLISDVPKKIIYIPGKVLSFVI